MGTSSVEAIKSIDPWMVFAIIFGIFYVFKEVTEASKYTLDALGLEKKSKIEKEKAIEFSEDVISKLNKMGEKIDRFAEDIDGRMDKMQKDIDNVTEASREELGDKINTKFKHYFTLGYIPADEYGEFVNLHRAYKTVGGNHSGDAKFKRCETLQIIDDTPESMKADF